MIKCMYMISQCDSNYANEIFETYIIYHIMYIICRVCLRITCPARYVALKGVVCVSYEPRKKKLGYFPLHCLFNRGPYNGLL